MAWAHMMFILASLNSANYAQLNAKDRLHRLGCRFFVNSALQSRGVAVLWEFM
ncbi:Uncharacterised protein [Bordetella avium]|nr:Uncharacterised protein [Bordetella avium]